MSIIKHLLRPRRSWLRIKYYLFLGLGMYRQLADTLYQSKFGKSINWKDPEDLNQWINWVAFKADTSMWPLFADKVKVREFVSEKGFSDILIPLLAQWKSIDEMTPETFAKLPDQFVLKSNNGSGDVIIVKDKSRLDIEQTKEHFRSILQTQHGRESAEPHYLKITPVIYAEKLLDLNSQSYKSSSIIDYKFWCFDGQPKWCFVCSNRSSDTFVIDLYDLNNNGWTRIDDEYLQFKDGHFKAKTEMPRPVSLDYMKEIATELSKGHPQMRVDLYEIDGHPFFGELTMTSAGGRMTSFNSRGLVTLGKFCKETVKKLYCNKSSK